MGKGYQGINPAPGRGGGKLLGARQSRAGHCACWVEQAECRLSCGRFAAASGLSRLCASLLEALGPPGLCESHWQGRDANSPGRYSDKPSEAAQAQRRCFSCLCFTKFSGTVILRDVFSLLNVWFLLEIRRYPALAGFKALQVGSK